MKKEDWQTEEFLEGINILIEHKPLDKSICKAVEELSELSTKLMQWINKPESINSGDIEEEIADVEQHIILLKHFFPISEEIRNTKISKFLNSKDYKKYLDIHKKTL
jgi:NTP pyrophosphatase (non-canonical NTP hydrolase)